MWIGTFQNNPFLFINNITIVVDFLVIRCVFIFKSTVIYFLFVIYFFGCFC
ncbi:hypothetical protein N665_0268s0057 [Sinapis alba]|nr:hypothetical protein N665_0268s0057 [Sinapis alba]